jgi:signal transduction histidine kinase
MIRSSIHSKRSLNSPFDRIIVFAAVLVVMVPILAYAWVALEADKANRTQLAMNRSHGTAQLVASLIDEHCENIVTTLSHVVRNPLTVPAEPHKRSAQSYSQSHKVLVDASQSLSELSYIAVYDADGVLADSVALNTGDKPSQTSKRLLQWFADTQATRLSYTEQNVAGGTIMLSVIAREDGKVRAMATAALPSSALDRWLPRVNSDNTAETGGSSEANKTNLYVVDEAGHVLTIQGPSWHRHLPLRDYQPTKLVINGQEGSLQSDGPDGSQESFVGYAFATLPRCGVLVVVPMASIMGPTNFLIQKLSLLLLPVLLLVSAWAWQRIRSERRIGELARQLAEQNEALRKADQVKSEFLANVSHDLRTPLAAMQVSISGLVESRSRWTQSEVRETLQLVGDEIDQLSARVRNLLDMARLEAGAGALTLHPEDLTDIVSSALERLEPLTRGNTIRANFPPEPLMIDGDQERLETVVINLIENAVKYSPEGSTIYLEGSLMENKATIRVWDEGNGLDPGDEDKVFTMYYRSGRGRAVRGTGVGLAICRAIVEAHGGKIGARRAETGGAEFWFTLAALPTHVEAEAAYA